MMTSAPMPEILLCAITSHTSFTLPFRTSICVDQSPPTARKTPR